MAKFIPHRPTEAAKAAAHAFYAGDDFVDDVAALDGVVDLKSAKARRAAQAAEAAAWNTPEMQDALTQDSLRALAEADKSSQERRYRVPANNDVQAIDRTRWPAVDAAFEPAPHQHSVDASGVADFALAGNARFTVVSNRTGTRFTFRVRQTQEGNPWFVSVLTGGDNTSDYTYLGTLFQDGAYRHGRKSTISATAPSAKAADWFFNKALRDPEAMAQCTVYHEGRCGRCGRVLTVPSSIASGIGPECAKHA